MLSFDETGLATGRIRPINAGNVVETHEYKRRFQRMVESRSLDSFTDR
jgi:hypothetical protein